jgi:WD40 repeat protein
MSSITPKRYDAFLSYNSQDRPAVHEVAERLNGEGLKLYLEEWELAPGREFQPALAEGLRDSKTCVVFLGPNGLGPWQKQELQVAIDERARDAAFHVIPVLLPGTERPRRGDVAHLEFLINASWVEFLTTLDDERAFRSLVWGITGTKSLESDKRYEGVCPYRGLEAFRPDDAKFFFGRANLTGWLVSALRREVRAAPGVRFLGVLGPSGSGKSSVVLAGLVPRLKAGAIEGSARWPVAVLRPGDDPLKNLAAGVVPRFLPAGALPDAAQVLKLIDDLRADARTLDVFAQMALSGQPEDVQLAVVVDQFEEVFTHRPQDDQARARFRKDRDQFFANLLHAAAAAGGRVAVVLMMRSDFLSACATFPQLAAVLSAHQEVVGPMTAAELREAIERPAFCVGCEAEPGLTERLLGDVEGQPGALPLLQFALTEVWKKREVRQLTLRAYTELGKDDRGERRGIEGVLEHRANEIYRNLRPEDQDLCRRLFLRLVQPGDGTEDTKRRVPYRELLPDDPARAEAVKRLVRTLADRDARLLTTEGADATGGAVEVAHEALIRGWAQLRQWVDAERAGLRTQRRLTEAAQEWAAAEPEHKGDYLYSGARLAVCREWAETHRGELSAIEVAFLAASEEAERQRKQDEVEHERRLREAAEAAREAERRRAEEAQAAAENQRRLGSRMRVAAVLAGLLAVTAVGLALWANKARQDADAASERADKAAKKADKAAALAETNANEAKAQARISDSRRLAALSEAERDNRLDRALLLAVEAVNIADMYEARNSLLKALQARPGLLSFLHSDEGQDTSMAFSADGKTLAIGYGFGVGGGGVVVWGMACDKWVVKARLKVPESKVTSVAFRPDGKGLAAGYARMSETTRSRDGGVVLWEWDDGQWRGTGRLPVRKGHQVTSVAFCPDGKSLAAGYTRGLGGQSGVLLWDVTDGKRQLLTDLKVTKETHAVSSVAFSRDGKTLAAGYRSHTGGVMLWKLTDGQWRDGAPLDVPGGWGISVAFRPDGKALAAGAGFGPGVMLWNLDDSKPQGVLLKVPEGRPVNSVAFRPDGEALAAGYADGGAVLWDNASREPKARSPLRVPEGVVHSVAFGPDGKALAVGHAGGREGRSGVVFWDPAGGVRRDGALPNMPEGVVHSVAFRPDGKALAAGYAEGSGKEKGGVMCWGLAEGKWRGRPTLGVPEGPVRSVAFSPDGKTLAAGYGHADSAKGGVKLWELTDDRSRGKGLMPVPEGEVYRVAFSPDGKTLAAGYRAHDGKGGVMLWEWVDGKWQGRAPLGVPEGPINDLAFSPDSNTLALAIAGHFPTSLGAVGGVRIFERAADKWQGRTVLKLSKGYFSTSVAYDRQGRVLAAGFLHNSVRYLGGVLFWDVASGERQGGLDISEGLVGSVAFSPDGKTLAAGLFPDNKGKGGAILWDVARGERLGSGPLEIPEGSLSSVAFSPDGKVLAAGYVRPDHKGGVVLLPAGHDAWIRLAEQIANRNLSLAEWRRYFPERAKYRRTFKDLPVPPMENAADASAPQLGAGDGAKLKKE